MARSTGKTIASLSTTPVDREDQDQLEGIRAANAKGRVRAEAVVVQREGHCSEQAETSIDVDLGTNGESVGVFSRLAAAIETLELWIE